MDVVNLGKIKKQMNKLPDHVRNKLYAWAKAVELSGLAFVRKQPGYHDEPLQGKRWGQRSIRLTKAYRAIYIKENNGSINLITVEEVHKHEY